MKPIHPRTIAVRFAFLSLAWLALVAVASPARAEDKHEDRHEDRREIEGRTLFAKGEYEKALDVYAQLFAEKGDPLYLRNVGRCYQKLKRPEKAIDSFREYLRRAKIKPRERDEVEGFIKEMEELQSKQAAAAPVEPPAASRPVEPLAPAPAAAPPPPPSGGGATAAGAPGAALTTGPGGGDAAEPPGITSRWWFWAGLGVLVSGGVATALVLGSGGGSAMVPACVPPAECPR